MSTPRRKRPTSSRWHFHDAVPAFTRWTHESGLVVCSAVDLIEGDGPTWHVSVSRFGGIPGAEDMQRVRADFDMIDAEEDNHATGSSMEGRVRHLWLPVNPAMRGACECKTEPQRVVEHGASASGDAFTVERKP